MFLAASADSHRQVPHLFGHHGKSLARFARPGGFHRGVEGQQVGLEGDLVDHLDDLGGLGGGLLDLVDGRGHLLHRLIAFAGRLLGLAPQCRPPAAAVSAFFLVMGAHLFHGGLVVSSRAAACSLAPWASDWLAEATCAEAALVCSEPADRTLAIWVTGLTMERVIRIARHRAAPPRWPGR